MAATVKSFDVNVTDGEITIRFQRNGNANQNAFINNIAILPSGGGDVIDPLVATNQAVLKGQVDGERLTVDGVNVHWMLRDGLKSPSPSRVLRKRLLWS